MSPNEQCVFLLCVLVPGLSLVGCETRVPVVAGGATTSLESTENASSSTAASSGLSSDTVGSAGTAGSAGTTGSGGTSPIPFEPCKQCQAPTSKGHIESVELLEVSGMAASVVHPGTYFVHNDSGDTPRFFAIDEAGHDLATYDVDGAFAVDWEDAAAGPCPVGHCIYLADIGDNKGQRTSYTVYRVTEPLAIESGTHNVASEALMFTYPDGSHNAETLLVHPTSGEIVIVTKVESGPSGAYRFPLPLTPGKVVVLEKIAAVAPQGFLPRFTGGSIHPKGAGVLLRTYTGLYYYPMLDSLAAALAGNPCSVPVALEAQGESVEWAASGNGYLTLSEGAAAAVNVVHCP